LGPAFKRIAEQVGIIMRDYLVSYESGDDGGWGAYAPDLPGLGLVGDSFEEAEELSRDGIAIHIAGLKEFGYPVPEPKTLAPWVAVAA
jgi:predicted RNase H-like HicB family nuclease